MFRAIDLFPLITISVFIIVILCSIALGFCEGKERTEKHLKSNVNKRGGVAEQYIKDVTDLAVAEEEVSATPKPRYEYDWNFGFWRSVDNKNSK